MPTDLTVAIAGHAPNTTRNIEMLLDDRLKLGAPDKSGYYSKPDRFGQITVYALLTDGVIPDGLKPALNILPFIDGVRFVIITDAVQGDIAKWTDSADRIDVVDDPFEFLISKLADAPSPQLYINWDDSDADDEKLVQLALKTEKITVRDLVEGLVEIVPDEEEPEPEQEPEEEEPPAPEKRARKRQELLEEEPEELEEEPAPPLPEIEKKQEDPQVTATSRQPVKPSSTLEDEVATAHRAQGTLPVEDTYTLTRAQVEDIFNTLQTASCFLQLTDRLENLRLGDDAKRSSKLTNEVTWASERVRAVLFPEVPYEKALADAKPAKAADDKRYKVVWDEDTTEWKKAGRGRTRAGVRVAWMDSAGNVYDAA